MIKKTMIIIMLMAISLLAFNQSVNAATVLAPEPAANTGGLWHVEDGNRVYVFMKYSDGEDFVYTGDQSNSEYPDLDYSLYTFIDSTSEEDFSFPLTSLYNDYATISNPDPAVYDTFNVEIIANMTVVAGGNPSFKTIESYSAPIDEVEIYLHNWDDRENSGYIYDYSYMTVEVDDVEVLSSRNVNQAVSDALGFDVNPNYDDLSFGIRMYWEKASIEDEINPGTDINPWEALPETTGSPVNPIGDWGTVSNIIVDNQNISFDVEYQGVTYPVASFTVGGNLDFVSEGNDVLYYSDPDTDDRILYFNFGDTLDSAILAARTFATVEEWKGEALWNLTQNEIKVTGVQKVYNYIPEVDDDGNVYSYFYMPDVEMDSLISVSSVLAYRYWDDGFLGFGDLEPGETQYRNVGAVRGEVNSVNPTWIENQYTNAYLFSAAASIITLTGSVVPIYGWGVSGLFFLAGGALQFSEVNEWFAYDVEQIQHVSPSVSLTNEINTYISETSDDDQFTSDTDKLYRLHLATLQDYDDVEIDKELSHVTQVVWETDGEIYVVNEENIDSITYSGPGTLPPPQEPGNDDLEMIVYIAAGFIVLYIISQLKINKWILLMIILGAAYYMYELGVI